eukprot:TRINITY_DN9098_c0_g1_i1.p1 TRINITY_DN9098_c0_g1~~TRINITY_DN9098_c0_g1_i1.p1  ORF type:complete len:428 (+),score=86.53 TRINITY_DN9098_c0_g1_i1:95-1378(+)
MAAINLEEPQNYSTEANAWIRGIFGDTLLPGAPWHHLQPQIEEIIKECAVATMQTHPEKLITYHLLGSAFVRKHFPDAPLLHSMMLEPPFMDRDLRDLLCSRVSEQLLARVREQCGVRLADNPAVEAFSAHAAHCTHTLLETIGSVAGERSSTGTSAAIAVLLERAPYLLDRVGVVAGFALPAPLRYAVWRHHLASETAVKTCEQVVTKEALLSAQGNFRKSSIAPMLTKIIAEEYKRSFVLYDDNERRNACSDSLNALFLHSHVYDRRFVALELPLAAVFGNSASMMICAALCTLTTNCLPSLAQTAAAGERVMALLSRADDALYAHLQESFQQRSETAEVGAGILVERWLSDAFASVLPLPCVLYVWDQCMMSGWETLEGMCVVVLKLFRIQLLSASQPTALLHIASTLPARVELDSLKRAYTAL